MSLHKRWGNLKFERVKAPSHSDMKRVVNTISHCIAQYLEKTGLIQRDMDNSYLDWPITASQRGKNSPRLAEHLYESDKPYDARSMSWAQRLKRVFNIDITQCEACEKFNVKIIACIIASVVTGIILAHLDKLSNKPGANRLAMLPPLRASPIEQDIKIQRDFDWGA